MGGADRPVEEILSIEEARREATDHILDHVRKNLNEMNGDGIPKLHGSCTGASPAMSMRFRSKAALYNGNIKGPKDPTNSGSERAGWNGVSPCFEVINAVASLNARLLRNASRGTLGSTGLDLRLEGESRGDSGREAASSSDI